MLRPVSNFFYFDQILTCFPQILFIPSFSFTDEIFYRIFLLFVFYEVVAYRRHKLGLEDSQVDVMRIKSELSSLPLKTGNRVQGRNARRFAPRNY